MSSKRFVLEGEWNGYRSEQQQVVHREVIPEWMAKRLDGVHSIGYTDGTQLYLTVRPCKPREVVVKKDGYGSLIRDCMYADIWTVQGLVDAKAAKKLAKVQPAVEVAAAETSDMTMEHVHEMAEDVAQEAIELEKEQAAELIEVAAEGRIVAADAVLIEDPQLAAEENARRLTANRNFITGLREMADLYESHPELKLPYEGSEYSPFSIFSATKEQLQAGARLGKWEKKFSDDSGTFQLIKTFAGGMKLQFWMSREAICEKVVTGKRIIEGYTMPARPAEVIPDKVMDIVEWRCGSIFDGADVVAVEAESDSADIPF